MVTKKDLPALDIRFTRKIPRDKWDEIWNLTMAGVSVPVLHLKVRDEWGITISESRLYKFVAQLKLAKTTEMNQTLFPKNEDDDMADLRWLRKQLMEIVIETRAMDKPTFFKATDKLIRIAELRLDLRKTNIAVSDKTDNGREDIIKELLGSLPDVNNSAKN